MEKKQIGWILIPPQVMADKRLTPSAKMLYGKINGLIGERGYCWASNETLAFYLGMGDIRNPLEKLVSTGYIRRVVLKGDGNKRHLYPKLPQLHTSVATATYPSVATATDTTMHLELEENNVAIAPSPPFIGTNPNTYSKKPRSPRDFTNARRADLGKPPIQPKRTEKQDIAVQALKLIDYFKQQFYEMHGEGVDSYFRGDSSENSKMVKLAKGCVVFLGGDARAYVDDWLAGKGEFFSYDPSNAWSNSQMSKWKASKTMKKETQDFMPTI